MIIYVVDYTSRAVWVVYVLIVLIFFLIQNKIYKLIKKRHPEVYKKLGNPSIGKWQNFVAYNSIFYGSIKFKDDIELTRYIIYMRIFAILMVIGLIFYLAVLFIL